ncbi:23S rRNA (cytidine(2498)-2'-O)-methyltransferase [hydrothermal vent metagenome]|uniref:23S rRNA (Cytidine(2498)-2'-O)-methyltransferase n=1 Tax=hydrothermal vent metagenome TaxID=652676 RepID=A0A3B0W901_9ZZZZ
MFNQIILLCRPGFEKECAGEIMEFANQQSFPAYVQTSTTSAHVSMVSSSNSSTHELISQIDFQQLIFTRQWFACNKEKLELPESNRLSDILKTIKNFNEAFSDANFSDVELDYADTNEGKSLSKFCKQFKPHLLGALKKNHLLSAHSRWRLHLFFTDSLHVNIGIAPTDNSSADEMGIMRLKMPGAAPSRSTLKMEEAIHWFLSTNEQRELIKNGMIVVDLGAAPGGWTWQFVQRNCLVTAIDNGPMQSELMKTSMVEHLQTDAFTYTPKKKVDWLICDMVERPLHVSRLIARWFSKKQCSNAIFNLKLPMKKRLATVHECIELLQKNLTEANIEHTIQAKHLYHDREEITVCITTI